MTLAVALTFCLALNGQQSVSQQVRAWIFRKLGIDPKIIQKFTSPKNGSDRRHAKRLMSVNLSDEQEHVLWMCGNCWSPAIVNSNDLAVLKDDGIWIIDGVGEPRRSLPAEGLVDVLGKMEGEPDHLLVLQSGASAAREVCAVVLRIADLKGRVLSPAAEGSSACIDVRGWLPHRDELSGTRLLSSTYRSSSIGPALELLVEDVAGPRGTSLVRLTPRLNARDSTRDRFDPIWRSPSEVVYLSNP